MNPKIKTSFSAKKDPVCAIEEIYEGIKQEGTKLVVIFIPAPYDQQKINEELKKKIPSDVPFIGCSSVYVKVPPLVRMFDNISSEGIKAGIVAMSIASDDVNASVRLMKNITNNWKEESEKALTETLKELNVDPKETNPKNFFGLLLPDSTKQKEEYILENLYARGNFLFIGGGSIGEYGLMKGILPGWIHTHEGVFTDAAAIAVVKTNIPFKIDMTTSVVPTDTTVKVTKAKDRNIIEIDDEPAAKVYARILGVPKILLGIRQVGNYWLFTDHPFGSMVGERAFVRSVGFRHGNELSLGCNPKEGEEMHLMKRADFLEPTKKMVDRIQKELGEVSGMLMFQCSYRFFETFRFKKSKEMFDILNIAPMIGMNAYGEYYGWASMAQTLTVLAFGTKK